MEKKLGLPELIQKGIEGMNKSLNEGQRSKKSMALCGTVSEDGEVWMSSNQACHAGLADQRFGKKTALVISRIQKQRDGMLKKEECIDFINWLVNDSKAYAHVFVTKDAEAIWETDMFACRADAPSNLVVGALILTRIMWEYTGVLKGWNAFFKAGIDGDAAILLGHAFSVKGKTVYVSRQGGHCALSSNDVSTGTLSNMLKSKPHNAKHNYRDNPNYTGGIHNCYGVGGDSCNNIVKLAKTLGKEPAADPNVYVNPFTVGMGKKEKNHGDGAVNLTIAQFVHGVNLWMGEM